LDAVVAKKAFACAAVLDRNARSQTSYSNELTVVSVENPENLTREHCGGGFLFQYFTGKLDTIEAFITMGWLRSAPICAPHSPDRR
jgi:hypothetical protein